MTKTKLNKNEIDNEIMKIIHFQLSALGLEPTKENIKLATVMFIEGVRFSRLKQTYEECRNE